MINFKNLEKTDINDFFNTKFSLFFFHYFLDRNFFLNNKFICKYSVFLLIYDFFCQFEKYFF